MNTKLRPSAICLIVCLVRGVKGFVPSVKQTSALNQKKSSLLNASRNSSYSLIDEQVSHGNILCKDAARQISAKEKGFSSNERVISDSGHDIQAYKDGFTSCPYECHPTILQFPELPSDFPLGTYYRNGPARFESRDGIRVKHFFDGDGMVAAVTFDSVRKRILFRNRFVQTEGFLNDRATGTMSSPGFFGTKASGGLLKNLLRLDFKNAANTNVIYVSENKYLYALCEGGWPYRMDPLSLETDHSESKGHNLLGLLKEGQPLAAHYRFDSKTKTIVGFSVQKFNPVAERTKITIHELHVENLTSVRDDEVSFLYEGSSFIHDFSITENWCIFSVPPASISKGSVVKVLLGQECCVNVIDFVKDADKTSILIIPRKKNLTYGKASDMLVGDDERIRMVNAPYHFAFHCVNAFDDSNGNVVFDTPQMARPDLWIGNGDRPMWETIMWNEVYGFDLVRYVLDPELNSLAKEPEVIVKGRFVELPTIPQQLSGQEHRYCYMVGTHKAHTIDPQTGKGGGPHGAIIKVDFCSPNEYDSYSFLPHEFVGEPMFVPKKGADINNKRQEDKGYVITLVVNGLDLTTDLVVLDVEGKGSLQQGPVARIKLPTFIPHGLHGTFIQDLTFDFDDA